MEKNSRPKPKSGQKTGSEKLHSAPETETGRSNIILIGMPASGKSTVGIVLAKALGYDFIDSDLLIQKKLGKRLETIIASEGIDRFLAIENEVNREITADHTVIAPGGSVIYGREAMEHFRRTGTIIYLKVSYDVLEDRLHDARRRGVALRDGQTLEDLYRERVPLYEKWADITVEEKNAMLEDLVVTILVKLKEQGIR